MGTGYSISETGSNAAQLIAVAYGVVIPSELMNLVAEQNFDHIVVACEELFPGQYYDVNRLTSVNDGRGNSIFIPVDDETRVYQNIRPRMNASNSSTGVILQESGRLSLGDNRLSDDSVYDLYKFSGQARQQVTISMFSQDFDTYLILENSFGETIDQDDDSGDGTNSQIVVTLPTTGTYRVYANAYAANSYGNYNLIVR